MGSESDFCVLFREIDLGHSSSSPQRLIVSHVHEYLDREKGCEFEEDDACD